MSQATSPSAGRPYGLERVCRACVGRTSGSVFVSPELEQRVALGEALADLVEERSSIEWVRIGVEDRKVRVSVDRTLLAALLAAALTLTVAAMRVLKSETA